MRSKILRSCEVSLRAAVASLALGLLAGPAFAVDADDFVIDSTHDLFSRAVRDALARARFTPAEAGGRKVRQLVEQAFTFRIDPGR